MLAGAVTVLFSLTGAEIVTVAAAESQVGARVLARLTTSVILRILLFYAGSVFCILLVLPWNRVVASQSPFVQALAVMDVPWAHFLVSAVILTAVLSCLNSAFYVCSRVLFGLAQHRDAPAWLVQVNERRVPARSVWISAAAGVLGVLVAIASPDRVFSFLVNASGALMIVVYALVALAQVKLRHRREAAGRARKRSRCGCFRGRAGRRCSPRGGRHRHDVLADAFRRLPGELRGDRRGRDRLSRIAQPAREIGQSEVRPNACIACMFFDTLPALLALQYGGG